MLSTHLCPISLCELEFCKKRFLVRPKLCFCILLKYVLTNIQLQKLQKIKSNSNAKLKITIFVLSKKNKNEYQHSISSTSNTNFISILRFEGAQLKKAPGAVSKRGPISKKNWICHFLAQGKI